MARLCVPLDGFDWKPSRPQKEEGPKKKPGQNIKPKKSQEVTRILRQRKGSTSESKSVSVSTMEIKSENDSAKKNKSGSGASRKSERLSISPMESKSNCNESTENSRSGGIEPSVKSESGDIYPSVKSESKRVCSSECQMRYHKVKSENLRLNKTNDELRKTVKDLEKAIEDLQVERENARAEQELKTTQKDFDRRLLQIEMALSQGLGCKPNTPQINRREYEREKAEVFRESPLEEHASRTNDKAKLLGEILGSTVEPLNEVQHKIDIPHEKDLQFDILDMDDDLDMTECFSNGNQLDSADDKSKDRAEHEISLDIISPERKCTEKKSEISKQPPIDNFDDITFFLRPSAASKKFMNSNDKLRRAISTKKEKKTSPLESKVKSKADAKRSLESDENAGTAVKRESVKRRRALAPVAGLNSRPSSARTSVKNVSNKVFDFVETPTLLEQSRRSIRNL